MTRIARACVAAALVALASCVPVSAVAASADALPDPNAAGFIGFCDESNHNVSGGSVDAAPFVWKAVASTPAPDSMSGRGQNAILNIYQPRANVPPSEWSGDSLTGASFYKDAAAPTVQATLKDIPLSVIVNEFPPRVNGLYQLRMYYGKQNAGLYSATYPATTIQVTDKTWRVVSGGTVNCGAAWAQSAEVLSGAVTPLQAYGAASLKPAQGKPSSSPTTAPLTQTAGGSTGSGQAPTTESGSTAAAETHPSSSSLSPAAITIAAAAALAAAVFAFLWWRQRTRPQ